MLHKLALATKVYSEEELLTKMAIISREEHLRGMKEMRQKATELAKLRGVDIPIVERDVVDVAKAKEQLRRGKTPDPTTILKEDIAGTRIRGKAPEGTFEKLRERGIQEEFGDVSKSKAKQLRHRAVGPVRRFWAGQSGLGSKWPNRLALLGALGTTGLGIKAYLDATRTPEALATGIPPELEEYFKTGAYVEDIASTPRPVAQPKVSPPTTKPPSALASSTRKPGAPGVPEPGAEGISGGASAQGTGGKIASPLQQAIEKQSQDDAIFPLAAAGAGGLAGYGATQHFLGPYLERKKAEILAEIARKQQTVKNLDKIHKFAPFGAAAAGAILLAALAAYKAKSKQEEARRAVPTQIGAYDPSGAGFTPEMQIPFGSPQGFY